MSRKRALLVGINYPGTRNELRGCVNDVRTMDWVISQKFGFTAPRERRMLTDASATTQNILERLDWLVDDAQPGDVLYFHYSGHGSQMIDRDYNRVEEPDGKDEIICPTDLNWRDKVIKDDDFKAVFNKVPKGVNLTVVLDCCHSGGGIDNVNEVGDVAYQPPIQMRRELGAESPNRNRRMDMPVDIESRSYGMGIDVKPRGLHGKKPGDVNDGILISGCRSTETSADAWIHNRYMGACTYYIAHTLSKHNFKMPYKQLADELTSVLGRCGYTQHPELNGATSQFNKNFLEPLI